MIEQVFISGQIGKAIYVEDGTLYILGIGDSAHPKAGRQGDLSLLFDCKAEFTQITESKIRIEKIKELLEADTDRQRALTFLISGFDDDLSDETRRLSIDAAEELLQNESVLAFVKARLFARPLPRVADIKGAISHALEVKADTVCALYKELVESQEAVLLVLEGWSYVPEQLFNSDEERVGTETRLIEAGVFGTLVSAITSNDAGKLNMSVVSYSRDLKRNIPQITLILNAIRTHILNSPAFASQSKNKQIDYNEPAFVPDSADDHYDDPIQELITRFESNRAQWQPRTFTIPETLERVGKQIDEIKRLIVQGNVDRAYAYLYDLVRFNLEHGKKVHAGMTLCSLAKAALDANAFEVAEQLVGYALLLNVEDPVIPTTFAQVYKAKGEFDEALLAYEEAISRFPDNVVARNGYAETLKAKGEFDKALSAYEEAISRFPDDVVTQNGYAETLKAKGEFDKALSAYEETISRFPDNVVARTGRAETLKAKGEFDKALSAYEETISRFPDNVIARSGYAETLKAKGEFDKALSIYEGIMKQFPIDAMARNGYASVLMLLGRFVELESALSGIRLITKNDWIAYHILAMSNLKRGNIDFAVEKLEYGLTHSPWHDTKGPFATALGVARIKQREFAKAVEVLSDNVVQLDIFQREKRLALIGHSQAALGRGQDAAESLTQIENSKNPHIVKLRETLKRRFSLVTGMANEPSESEKAMLDQQIEDTELFLAIQIEDRDFLAKVA